MGFWVQHGFHFALVAVPSSAMGAGLAVERRRGRRQRHATADGGVSATGSSPAADRSPGRPTTDGRAVTSTYSLALPAVVISAVGAALVHLVVMPEHFGESFLYGMFFLSAAIMQLLWAAAVTYRPSRVVLISGAAGCAAVIVLWIVSRTAGIPPALGGLDGGSPETLGALDVLATAFEAVAVVGVGFALRTTTIQGGSPLSWPRAAQLAAGTALCGTAAVALWAPVS